MRAAPSDRNLLASVLASYGVIAGSLDRITSGRMNEHWRVVADDGTAYALRRYTIERTGAAIIFEHEAIAHAGARGWPVAEPIPCEDGDTSVSVAGRHYALFPFLPGRPRPRSVPMLRIKGRLLARLHRDFASWPAQEQRPGRGRVWGVDAMLPPEQAGSFNDVLLAFGREHRELASLIRGQRYRSLRELSRLGYGELPDMLVHFDFHNDNLLFDGARLAALLDFDSVHMDARAADIACSIANDCPEPPADIATSPGAAAAFVGGYIERTPLDQRELRLIVPLLRAYRLMGLPRTLAAWAAGRHEEVFPRLRRLLEQRLPALDANGAEIESAIMQAADAAKARD